jgi:hypothetical protein
MDGFLPPKPAGSNKSAPNIKEPKPDNDPTNLDIEPEYLKFEGPGSSPSSHIDPPKTKNKRFGLPRLRKKKLTKTQWGIISGAVLMLIAAGSFAGSYLYKHFTKLPPQKKVEVVKKEVKPKTVPSRLTGVQTTVELNSRTITGVMIENSPDARPQSGLYDAGVVYEAIAEGGITRFMAVYLEATPDYIGPVRSARPYYLDFILPYQGAYAHVGGSPDALAQIKSLGIRDLDQFANAAAYQRVSQRYAPHNVYTSIAKLDELQKKKGYTKSEFVSLTRKKDQASKTPTAKSIDLAISSFLYNVHYDYNAASNSYARAMGGKPHMDEKAGKQINPKVVIAVTMPYSIASDGKHSVYGTTGSGTAQIFQDGTVTKATWSKPARSDQIIFKDAQGQVVKLNAGQTWISLVKLDSNVTYKP